MKKQSDGIGQRIRQRRIDLGLSQELLALKTGYSRIYILKLENNRVKNPGIKTLENISLCLGLKLEQLWK